MKRLTILVATLGALLQIFSLSTPALAANVLDPACQNPNAQSSSLCKDKPSTGNPLFGPGGILTTAINLLSIIAGLLSVFVIMIAGIKMITSGGESNSIASSKRAILYAVISLMIVAFAQTMVRFVLNRLPS